MKKCGRRLSMFLLVSLLVCCSLWAFPGRKAEVEEEPEIPALPEIQEEPAVVIPEESLIPEAPEEVKVVEVVVEPPIVSAPEQPEVSEETQEEGLMQLVSLLETLEKSSKLSKTQLAELSAELEMIRTEYGLIVEDAEEKEAQITELTSLNAQQADDLAYLRGAYDKETSTKAYAKTGMVIGFRDTIPTYGVSAAIGARLWKGLLLEAGVQYTIGSFREPLFKPSIDNLSVTGSIGWEW